MTFLKKIVGVLVLSMSLSVRIDVQASDLSSDDNNPITIRLQYLCHDDGCFNKGIDSVGVIISSKHSSSRQQLRTLEWRKRRAIALKCYGQDDGGLLTFEERQFPITLEIFHIRCVQTMDINRQVKEGGFPNLESFKKWQDKCFICEINNEFNGHSDVHTLSLVFLDPAHAPTAVFDEDVD